jgi:hypothetical protein
MTPLLQVLRTAIELCQSQLDLTNRRLQQFKAEPAGYGSTVHINLRRPDDDVIAPECSRRLKFSVSNSY